MVNLVVNLVALGGILFPTCWREDIRERMRSLKEDKYWHTDIKIEIHLTDTELNNLHIMRMTAITKTKSNLSSNDNPTEVRQLVKRKPSNENDASKFNGSDVTESLDVFED